MTTTPALNRLDALSTPAKAGMVVGGYIGAVLCAMAVVWVYVTHTMGPDRDQYSGMYAFGDMMLFIAVFGALALGPTLLGLFWLRRKTGLWMTGGTLAVATSGTAMMCVMASLMSGRQFGAYPSLDVWAAAAFPRLFVSPFLGAIFGAAAWLAPSRGFRRVLLAAATMEGIGCLYGFVHWFVPLMLERLRS